MEIPGEKTLLTIPAPSILKQLIEKQNDINFYFQTSLRCLRKVYEGLFGGARSKCENKKFMSSPPLFGIGTTRAKTVFFV